jgi:Starch-binding associating with outer membrane
MKKISKIILIFLCALGLFLTNACTKKYETLNTDPRLVTADLANVGYMLTNVEMSGIVESGSYGNGTYGAYCGMDVRSDDNPFTNAAAPGEWDFQYTSQLNNLSNIIQLIEAKPNKADLVNEEAIARILKAWDVSLLTDTYGDVPYSQSCLPIDKVVLSPKYDTQQSIYLDLFKELTEAAAQLDDTKDSYGSADLVYGGDTGKWRKLANSLRLRLALRVSYVDPALATQQLSDLTEAGLLATLDDDAFVKNNTDYPDHLNPRYYRIINYGTVQESVQAHKVLIDILRNDGINEDPRIGIYADTITATFKGGVSANGYPFPNIDYRGQPTLGNVTEEYKYPWGFNTTSQLSDLWRVPVVAPAIMKCSEVYFSLAEAQLRGLLPAGFNTDPNYYYQKGIDAGIDWAKWFYNLVAPQIPDLMKNYLHYENHYGVIGAQWTDADVSKYLAFKAIKDAAITAFKATPVYTLSGSTEGKLEMIINQKLIALYPDEFQGWCEYRRTGYPQQGLSPDVNSELKGKVPRREKYPISEQTTNSANYNDALTRIGVDSRLSKFWWDANPASPHVNNYVYPTQPTAYQ